MPSLTASRETVPSLPQASHFANVPDRQTLCDRGRFVAKYGLSRDLTLFLFLVYIYLLSISPLYFLKQVHSQASRALTGLPSGHWQTCPQAGQGRHYYAEPLPRYQRPCRVELTGSSLSSGRYHGSGTLRSTSSSSTTPTSLESLSSDRFTYIPAETCPTPMRSFLPPAQLPRVA